MLSTQRGNTLVKEAKESLQESLTRRRPLRCCEHHAQPCHHQRVPRDFLNLLHACAIIVASSASSCSPRNLLCQAFSAHLRETPGGDSDTTPTASNRNRHRIGREVDYLATPLSRLTTMRASSMERLMRMDTLVQKRKLVQDCCNCRACPYGRRSSHIRELNLIRATMPLHWYFSRFYAYAGIVVKSLILYV